MKLNWSFLIDTALAITLLTSATLSAEAQEVNYCAQDHSSMSRGEVITAADFPGSDCLIDSSDQEFSLTHSISRELALAVLIIAVCRLIQGNYNSQPFEQAKPSASRKPENRYLFVGLGLGSFYQSVNGNQKSNKKVKRINRIPRKNTTCGLGRGFQGAEPVSAHSPSSGDSPLAFPPSDSALLAPSYTLRKPQRGRCAFLKSGNPPNESASP